MCILTFIPEGVQPDTDALANGADNNPDGHGFAIVDTKQSRIVVRRGMEPNRLIDEFVKMRKTLDGPALFHSRIATAGLVEKVNCHPFRVGNDPTTVVAHNGILPREAQPAKSDWRSDTRIFAETLLPGRNFDGRRSMKKLAHWLAGDKLVILTVNPRWEANAYLVNSSKGEWDVKTGIWYSNQSYRDDYNAYRYYGRGYYKLKKCVNYEECGCWTYMDSCLNCRGEWGRGRPLALESGPVLSECAYEGCKIRSVYAFCSWHGGIGQAWPTPDGHGGDENALHTRLEEPCAICEAKWVVSTVTRICTVCLTCQDCLEETGAGCLCYYPRQQSAEDVPDWAEGTVIG